MTLSVDAAAVLFAVTWAVLHAAGVSREALKTHTLAIHAVALVIAVIRTCEQATVMARVTSMANASSIYTVAIIITIIRTHGDGAVWTLPACITFAAACVVLVYTMATTACVHT